MLEENERMKNDLAGVEKVKDQLAEVTQAKLGLEQELHAVYNDVDAQLTTVKSRRAIKDRVSREYYDVVGEVVASVFKEYKFMRKGDVVKYTPDDKSTLCGREKDAVEECGLVFNQKVWIQLLVPLTIKKLVELRAKFVSVVRNAYFGETTTCSMFVCCDSND